MKKITKRIISFALAIVLVLGLAACAGNTGGDATATSAQASADTGAGESNELNASQDEQNAERSSELSAEQSNGQNAGQSEQNAGQSNMVSESDKFAKYDPPLTITSVKRVRPNDVYPEGQDMYNNAFIDALLNEVGIKVDFLWMVDTAQSQTRYDTMMASGDFPDLWWAFNMDFINLAQNDAVMDISGVYDTWASAEIKRICESFPEGFDAAKINDKLYGMPAMGAGIIGAQEITWIRKDWLDQVGMSVPKTLEEEWNMMVAFKELKDGNYGFSLDKDLSPYYGFGPAVITNAYDAFYRMWMFKDGKIQYGGVQPEMKEALLYLQKMYAEGLLHPEFVAMDGGACAQDIASGKVGVYGGPNWSSWWPLQDAVVNDDAEWIPIVNPTPDGSLGNLPQLWPINEVLVVNKTCEHPEALFKMINNWVRLSQEGVFNVNEEPYKGLDLWRPWPVDYNDPFAEWDMAFKALGAFETRDTTDFTPEELSYYDAGAPWLDGDIAGYGRYMQIQAFLIMKIYNDSDKIILTEPKGTNPEYYSSIKSTLEQLEVEAYIKIIMGAPIDEFDDFVENWYKIGGQQATDEINAVYN